VVTDTKIIPAQLAGDGKVEEDEIPRAVDAVQTLAWIS
jgi:hypothetical protein